MFPVPPPNPNQPELSPQELQEGFTSVDVTLKAPTLDDEELVTVATFPLVNQAELAKLHLAEEGIKATLADAETVNMDWILGNAVGYIKVQVLRSNAEAAAAVLSQVQAGYRSIAHAGVDDESAESMVCLACGEELVETESKCPACGWSYESREDT